MPFPREVDLKELKDDLAKLDGLPPYNTPSNICRDDGYFSMSLERKYDAPIAELRKRCIA